MRLSSGGDSSRLFRSLPWWGYMLVVLAILIAIFVLLLVIWMYWLMFNVSLFAKEKDVPCDKPLADWLLGAAIFGVANLFLALVLPCFAPRSVLLGHGVLTGVGWLAFFIAGHIFVWTSKTCAQTSKGFVPVGTLQFVFRFLACTHAVRFRRRIRKCLCLASTTHAGG